MHSLLKPVLLLATFITTGAYAETLCNGYAELCSRSYSNVSQIGTHDSAFVGSSVSDNQAKSVTDQLNAGIRFLQAQSHLDSFKQLSLCHTSCFLEDAGSVQGYLATIKSWLDANPNEVVTVLLTNGDNVDISLFDTAFSNSGIKSYAYIPPTSPLAITAWPTLGDMIKAGARLVVFLGQSIPPPRKPLSPANPSNTDTGANPSTPYILDEFSYFFETPYDTLDPNFPECTLDRPSNASPAGRMYIVNHFLDISIFGVDIPDRAADPQTNAATGAGSIGAQVAICDGMYVQAPKGVLVDNFDVGDVFTAQKALNGL